MRICLLIILLIAPLASAAPPASQPVRPGYRLVDGQWISVGKMESWQSILSVDLVDGQLIAKVALDKSMLPKLAGGRRIATTIGESPLAWVMSYSNFTGGGDASKRGNYLRAAGLPVAGAPEGSDRLRLSGVLIEPTGLLIRGEGMVNDHKIICELHQEATTDTTQKFLSLKIIDQPANGQPRQLDAKAIDFRMLLVEQGDAMRGYVAPLLDELAGKVVLAPRAADVYRIWRDIPASAEGNAKLAAVLAELSDRDPQVRKSAEAKMNGADAALMLAAIRVPRAQLNSPQQGAILRFIERNQLVLDAQVERTREDLLYLIDCLDFEDRAVRERAKAGIERYIDEKIEFDLDLEGTLRTRAVQQLRLRHTQPLD